MSCCWCLFFSAVLEVTDEGASKAGEKEMGRDWVWAWGFWRLGFVYVPGLGLRVSGLRGLN